MDYDLLIKAYEDIEKARIDIYKLVNKAIWNGEQLPSAILSSDAWKAKCEEGIVKVYIPDIPPRTTATYKDFKERWIKNMISSLDSLEECPTYEKVMVWVKVFLPIKDWDIDNRAVKPIIDGIRYSRRIIRDDIYKHVAYGFEGEYSQNPHTEVYIINFENIGLPTLTW